MQKLSRTLFLLCALASGLFWASEQGYLSAECSACAGADSSGTIALSGAIAYLLAAFLTPKRWQSAAALLFAGAHGLLVFSQVSSGEFCWFCVTLLVVALIHAALRVRYCKSERQGAIYAFASGAVVATLMLAIVGSFGPPVEEEVIETQHFAATSPKGGESLEQESKAAQPVDEAEVEPAAFEGPVLVKAYIRSTCGFCKDFKNQLLPQILEMEDVPAFTVQYIAAEKGRSVPYFELSGARTQEIKGLTSAKRFASALRDVSSR